MVAFRLKLVLKEVTVSDVQITSNLCFDLEFDATPGRGVSYFL